MTHFARYASGTLAALAAYALAEPHFLRIKKFDVAMKNLPREAENLRIVQLSDFHLSAITSAQIAKKAIATANALKPDLVVLTGDLVSRENSYAPFLFASLWAKTPRQYAQEIAPILGELRATHGVFSVHGNHDASAGSFQFLDSLLQRNGVRVLVNSSTRIRNLPLIGLDDLRVGRIHLQRAFEGTEETEAQVILSHNPRVLPLLRHRNALVLSGHTHGGQARVPLKWRHRPFDMRNSIYHDGWYQDEAARMYVNAGIGSVHLPLRFFCAPEIAVFTLRNEPQMNAREHRCTHE